MKRVSVLLVALPVSGRTFGAEPPGVRIRMTRPDANVTYQRNLAEAKAFTNVQDAMEASVLGLIKGAPVHPPVPGTLESIRGTVRR